MCGVCRKRKGAGGAQIKRTSLVVVLIEIRKSQVQVGERDVGVGRVFAACGNLCDVATIY